MAIVIRGKTVCRLCSAVHAAGDDVMLFPSGLFTPGEAAFEVDDAGVHRHCLVAQPYAEEAVKRLADYREQWQ